MALMGGAVPLMWPSGPNWAKALGLAIILGGAGPVALMGGTESLIEPVALMGVPVALMEGEEGRKVTW